MKTRHEIESLKKNWELDPCWDLYETEGFEEYREELKIYQEKCEAKWRKVRLQREREIDVEAEKLGVKGLYRLIKKHEELLNRHNRAIEALNSGNKNIVNVHRILLGIE